MKFIFEIEPVSQLRPRATTRPFVHLYDPPKVAAYKRQIGTLAKAKMSELGLEPLTGPLQADMIFYRSIQKSLSKAEKLKRATGQHYPAIKPDGDNYVKALWDALNGIVWQDDAQIVDHSVKKRYSLKPRVVLEVKKLA